MLSTPAASESLQGDIAQRFECSLIMLHRLCACLTCRGLSCSPVPAGEMRNDLYMTLEKGEFEKGGKSVARNVEITVYVLDADGQILKVNKHLYFLSCVVFITRFLSRRIENDSSRWEPSVCVRCAAPLLQCDILLLRFPPPPRPWRENWVKYKSCHCNHIMLNPRKHINAHIKLVHVTPFLYYAAPFAP